jgi:hypothetical protein
MTGSAQTALNLTLTWDTSTDPTVVGYNLYYGPATRTYTNVIPAGAATIATLSNARSGATYYFAATTYNAAGLESDYSAELSYTAQVIGGSQPPTLDLIPNLTINENAGLQTVNLTGISAGAGNAAPSLTVTASSGNTGLIPNPSVAYASPNATGSLSFTPVAQASGTATITVTVNNGGASNNLVSQTFTVTVNAVPPTLDPLANLTINENAGPQTVNLTGISAGAGNTGPGLTVTAFSSNTGLIPNPSVTYTSPKPTGTLSFTPAANGSGSSTVTVMVDNGGAVSNTVIRSFTVTVNPFNAAPTLDFLSNLTLNENDGPQVVNLTGISTGATNEVQTLTVTATSSNPGLVPNPAVAYTSPNPTGTLTLTPVPNGYGSANITVTVNDGQPINNLVSRLFTVTINQTGAPPAQVTTNWTLIWQNTNGLVGHWTMSGSNLVSTAAFSPAAVGPGWTIVGSASLNGDGNEDLILQHINGSVAAWLMNDTNCTQVLSLMGVPSDPNWRVVATGDLDGDGQKDLLFEYPDGSLAVSFVTGTNCGPILPINPPKVDPGWRIVGTGDVDGDGQTDILLQHKAGWIGVFFMNSTNATRFSLLNPAIVDPSWKIVGARDFKGDGQGQLLWRSAAGYAGSWQMNNTNFVTGGIFNPPWVSTDWQIVGPR